MLLIEAIEGRRLKLGDTHPHTQESLNNLIDLGEGSRMFQSGGGAALGRHSASWETFWCIRAQRAQKWPDGWGPDMMNFVAVQPGQESVTDADGRWFEAIGPARLHPHNLYESQIRRRFQSSVLSQRNR